MKSYVIIGCGAALFVLAAWITLDRANLFVVKGMILQGLVGDVANFYGENERLPFNWEEFVSWANTTHTSRQWTADELNSRFALKWGANVSLNDSNPPRLFIVLVPEFKDIELPVNAALYSRCLAAAEVQRDRYQEGRHK